LGAGLLRNVVCVPEDIFGMAWSSARFARGGGSSPGGLSIERGIGFGGLFWRLGWIGRGF